MARDSRKRTVAAVERADLPRLFHVLRKEGYQLLGPTVREGAIIYDEVTSLDNLPTGYTDEQQGGVYCLSRRKDQALFGYAVGPHSWKKYLFPPAQRLFRAKRDGNGFQILTEDQARPRYAFIGVRACELHALAIQDKVFLGGKYVDPVYQGRREGVFIVAVNCGQAGGTCFCVSMQTGPKAATGFDLALTEILEANRHWFLIEAGTDRGARVLADIPHRPATTAEAAAADQVVAKTAAQMGRALETAGLKEFLLRNYEHPRWEEVAARCLTCANCTLVCPTCFCSTVEDVTDLTGEHAERWRKWDSCFTADFTHIVGGVVRASAKSRYRQWLTHKLATWFDQFGASGCVGCGRCITWCPVGIDLTEEVRILRETETARATTA
ncbi:MAG: 4Fe-4S dicluster domain-containing protein [Chloroflexi bacterium]|nr:4Fe-4S dicluster domain-containing protein [Chloroflexota bacterium]